MAAALWLAASCSSGEGPTEVGSKTNGPGAEGGSSQGQGSQDAGEDASPPADAGHGGDAGEDAGTAPYDPCSGQAPPNAAEWSCCGGSPCRGTCTNGQCVCHGIEGGCWEGSLCCRNVTFDHACFHPAKCKF